MNNYYVTKFMKQHFYPLGYCSVGTIVNQDIGALNLMVFYLLVADISVATVMFDSIHYGFSFVAATVKTLLPFYFFINGFHIVFLTLVDALSPSIKR